MSIPIHPITHLQCQMLWEGWGIAQLSEMSKLIALLYFELLNLMLSIQI